MVMRLQAVLFFPCSACSVLDSADEVAPILAWSFNSTQLSLSSSKGVFRPRQLLLKRPQAMLATFLPDSR